MSAPSNANKLTLGGPLIDPTMFRPDTDPAVVQMFMNLQAALIGMGWPSGAQSTSDTTYQAVYYSGGDFYGGKPEDPLNPDLLLASAGGTVIVQEEGVSLASPTGTLNFIGASVTAVLNGAVADITVVGGSSNSFETIDCPSGTDPVASSATDTLTFTDTGAIVITGDSGSDTVDFNVQAYATIQEEGSDLAQRFKLNFSGSSVTASDDAGNARTNVTVTAYNTVQDEGGNLTQRSTINFTGNGVSAADAGGITVVTITDTNTTYSGTDGVILTGTTFSASGEVALVTTAITGRSDTTGPDYTMGVGTVTLLARTSAGVYTETGGATGVTVYNSEQTAVPTGRIVQLKWIRGDLFVDTGDCG
jgi:hypothetical protein